MVANLLGAVSKEPEVVCGGGSNVDVLRTVDKKPFRRIGLQYPHLLLALRLEKLLRKPSYSVIGRINMFALLATFLPRIIGCLDCKEVQSTHNSRKVCYFTVKGIILDKELSLLLLCFFKTEDQVLDKSSLHLMVQELIQQRSNMCGYIESTFQRQAF